MPTVLTSNGMKAALPFEGACGQCSYDLRGLTDTRCPECGAAFDRSNSWPRRWLEGRASAHRNALICLIGATVIAGVFALSGPRNGLRSPRLAEVAFGGGALGFLGILPVVVAVGWCWDEAARRLTKWMTPARHNEENDGPRGHLPTVIRYLLGMLAFGLIMLLWLPALILAFIWLPPVAVTMHLVESARTRARYSAAVQTPYAVDTRRQFGQYRFWGFAFTVTATIAWCTMIVRLT